MQEGTQLPAEFVNAAFVDKLLSGAPNSEGISKVAAAMAQSIRNDVIRNRERGVSFCNAIIPPKQLSPSDFVILGDTEIPYKFEYVDVKHPLAMAITFSGGTDARLIRSRRFQIGLYPIAMQTLTFEILKLRFHPVNIRDLVLEKVEESIEDTKDRQFMLHMEAGVQALHADVNSGGTTQLNATNIASVNEYAIVKGESARAAAADNFTLYNLQRADIRRVKRTFSGRGQTGETGRLTPTTILITDYDLESFNDDDFDYNTLGGDFALSIHKEGVKMNKWQGLKVVKTNKTHILRPGNVYFFADVKFYGRHYVVDPLQLFIDPRDYRFVHIDGFCSTAMGFGNLHAAKKLELYSGAINPAEEDTGYAIAAPVAESALQDQDLLEPVERGIFRPATSRY